MNPLSEPKVHVDCRAAKLVETAPEQACRVWAASGMVQGIKTIHHVQQNLPHQDLAQLFELYVGFRARACFAVSAFDT